MNINEFVIRLLQVNELNRTKIIPIIENLSDQINEMDYLNLLNLTSQQITQFYQTDISATLDWLDDPHHHFIHYGDPRYPVLLKQTCGCPLSLFVLGDPDILQTPQLAMVGSRSFSEYGAQWARYFSSELAVNGLTITSGLALGIDAICHRGALEVSGKTIAVLGSGLNQIYPRTNFQLAKEIVAQQGAIISEFFPNEKARAEYFPRRNRIISGLSLGTFVVEASQKSGSLITARLALEQNRDVFALPGDITNPNSDGTHWLIQQGAYLVIKPSDILEHYSNSLSWIKAQSLTSNTTASIIHPEIFAIISNKPIPVDIVAQQVQQPISNVTVKLLELELEGLIKTVSGGYIRQQAR